MPNKIPISGIFLFSMLISSCAIQKGAKATSLKKNSTPEIMFADFLAVSEHEETNIQLINTTVREGKIKPDLTQPEQLNYPVEVVLKDRSGNRIQSLWIEHPLIRIWEYSSPEGELKLKKEILDSATFTIRYQNNPAIHHLQLISQDPQSLRINQEIRNLK